MALFRRRKATVDEDGEQQEETKKKADWKRPANTAFKQQRLKAWQPILTPKTVLPTLFIIGLLFAPIGGLLIWGSGKITQITLDYTGCDNAGANFTASSSAFVDMPSSAVKYDLKADDSSASFINPQWSFRRLSESEEANALQRSQCRIRFELPSNLTAPVFLYYKLTNFYQNHRRYVQSLNTDQLKGGAVSAGDLDAGNCRPLAKDKETGKAIYPCGLIANSFFNDTLGSPIREGTTTPYVFSEKNIAWPGERKKYTSKPKYNPEDIVPPPNWRDQYKGGYTADNIPDLANNEHFHNWMRTAGLPTFSKLYGRNQNEDMVKGIYTIDVMMNFPVRQYDGTKSVVISTVSWIGGKNPFLGWAYIGAGALFVLLAVGGLVWHCLKPRRLGDMNLLSWNQPPR